jgi:RimJ/RimL family protein N-acetyltransferase
MLFDFENDYILENNFVQLRPLTVLDIPVLLPFSEQEPELWNYSLINATNEKELINYVNLALEGRKHKREYAFVVYDKIQQKIAGSTRFYDVNLNNKSLQLGFTWYGKAFQGTGMNKQCKLVLLDFAFDFMQMERVEFRADNQNKRSIAAMKRIGCVEEGVLRSNFIKPNGERRSSIVLSILKSEWEQSVKANLEALCVGNK